VFVIGDLASILKSDGFRAWLRPLCRKDGTPRAMWCMRFGASLGSRLFTSTRARWRRSAVAQQSRKSDGLGSGVFVAWIAWLFNHIFYLIGFRNRFMVLAGWAWVYLRNESGARLITGDIEPLLERGESGHDKHRMISS
jgi:NADH dehydrogenase